MVTGGLLYHWMTEILRYDSGTSSTAACIYTVAILFLSFLCHPLRCVLTMILPTLGTKQGRKLIISTSVIVLVLNIILNITVNMGVVMHVLKCTSEVSGPWLLDVPATAVSIAVKYKVHLRFPGLCIIPAICGDTELANFHKQYDWTFNPEALLCDVEPSAPDLRVRVLLGLLCLVSYIMVLLEVYARRIRRKVSASFFKKQEEKRINFLLKKIQAKQDTRENNIFFIEAVNETSVHTNQNVI
ncbi:hypothetical protein J4Q44_G00258450 [Coregonus suidteri]|uniref:Dendritic cell-specific transmembrane protein-like domain-containing protein n=1 Tax=Coregonus suidteri TaxID=861788 RepID=A0AAN8LLJ4_9TELE